MILSGVCELALYNIEQIRIHWDVLRWETKMAETKGERRERKRRKRRYGHKVRGRSVQTLQRIIMERARRVQEGRDGVGPRED